MPNLIDEATQVLDLNHDFDMGDSSFVQLGLEQQCADGWTAHQYIVTVHGRESSWAIYDQEEGKLDWCGHSEASFDALYMLRQAKHQPLNWIFCRFERGRLRVGQKFA
ncbi:MAG: hypothetical protein AAGJ35_12210 [Myxococcota bacterium]